MGLTISRLHLEIRHFRRRRSQQDETIHGYSLNKNYFCNYFYMGGERFDVNDPNYLFGDNCDLNFLTCTKPYKIPYKKAQQNLLSSLNTKQKAINKASSRMGGLSSPLNILTGRHRHISQSHKQDAQTQTFANNQTIPSGPQPSQPLVVLVHIRKETLKIVKVANSGLSVDSDQSSRPLKVLASSASAKREVKYPISELKDKNLAKLPSKSPTDNDDRSRESRGASLTEADHVDGEGYVGSRAAQYSKIQRDSDTSSITSDSFSAHSTITSKSGYTSVRDIPPSECPSDENDDCYQDALNDPTNLSIRGRDDENEQAKIQHHTSKIRNLDHSRSKHETKVTIDHGADGADRNELMKSSDIKLDMTEDKTNSDTHKTSTSFHSTASNSSTGMPGSITNLSPANHQDKALDQTYNIEFLFDSEVDCSIRVYYFCNRDVTLNNVAYKPRHATYKSKLYTYKKGLGQKFEQAGHTFQPHLFDEDLLIFKPLDSDGNYNSGAVFPIVIHCTALEGPNPRQSQSLVATIEKSQLDDSYSIKPLKQLLFVDGVQYILQDIYGIENKPLVERRENRASLLRGKINRNMRSSNGSLYSRSNMGSNLNMSDTASINSAVNANFGAGKTRDAASNDNQYLSLASENTFECVICMSDERDTMLLPCRHLCLCSSCAQSLRYQASSCPICRCPFKAALNIHIIQRHQAASSSNATASLVDGEANAGISDAEHDEALEMHALKCGSKSDQSEHYDAS